MESSPTFWQFFKTVEELGGDPYIALEDVIRETIKAFVRPGDVVIDGGAHHGNHTLPLSAAVGPKGIVYAIEPVPESFSRLKMRLKQKGMTNCRLFKKALDETAGRVTFHYVSSAAGYSGIERRSYPEHVKESDIEEIEVETVTIDSLVPWWRKRPPVRFIKLDLEGGEFNALKGGVKTIRKDRPVIAFENSMAESARQYGYSRDDFFWFFRDYELTLVALTGEPVEEDWWGRDDRPFYFWALPIRESESFLRSLDPAIERVLIKMRES